MEPSIEVKDPPASKPVKRKKAARSSAPRVIDPVIVNIHAEAKARVQAYRKNQASKRILATIIMKRFQQLTVEDKQYLFDELKKHITPSLPGTT